MLHKRTGGCLDFTESSKRDWQIGVDLGKGGAFRCERRCGLPSYHSKQNKTAVFTEKMPNNPVHRACLSRHVRSIEMSWGLNCFNVDFTLYVLTESSSRWMKNTIRPAYEPIPGTFMHIMPHCILCLRCPFPVQMRHVAVLNKGSNSMWHQCAPLILLALSVLVFFSARVILTINIPHPSF